MMVQLKLSTVSEI